MSILYQALKRRDQLEAKPEAALRPSMSSSYNGAAKRSRLRPLLALLILAAGGYVAYTTYFTPTSDVTPLATPVVAEAPIPDVAPVVTAPADTVTLPPGPNDMSAVELKSIADVAAMLPESAAAPLPVPPIKVESDNSKLALSKRAMQLQSQGARDAAISMYTQAGDDYHNQVNKWGLIAASQPQKAVPPLRKLVADRPNDGAARAQLGIALIKLGKGGEARVELEKATALTTPDAPTSTQVWYNLAILYDQSNMKPQAIDAYQRAITGAVGNGHEDVVDITAIQRRLNYLRSAPPAPTAVEAVQTAEEKPFSGRANVP